MNKCRYGRLLVRLYFQLPKHSRLRRAVFNRKKQHDFNCGRCQEHTVTAFVAMMEMVEGLDE